MVGMMKLYAPGGYSVKLPPVKVLCNDAKTKMDERRNVEEIKSSTFISLGPSSSWKNDKLASWN
jgi:hypothetical protein